MGRKIYVFIIQNSEFVIPLLPIRYSLLPYCSTRPLTPVVVGQDRNPLQTAAPRSKKKVCEGEEIFFDSTYVAFDER